MAVDTLAVALVSALASFAGSWGAVKVHLAFLRRDVDAAHRRLDQIGAPAAWMPLTERPD